MKVLVTGASGFAGSHLVEYLQEQYPSAVIHGTYFGDSTYLQKILPDTQRHALNLVDKQATEDLMQKIQPDRIFHLAAFAFVGASFERAAELLQNNVSCQLSMLDAVRKVCPMAAVLCVGSAEEYGWSAEQELPIREDHPLRPVNPYAVSKVAQDLLAGAYAKSFDLHIYRVRPFNHIGPRQSLDFAVPAFVKQIVAIERGEQTTLRVGSLDAVRDFTDVRDMVRAYDFILSRGEVNEVYNVGSGVGVRMSEVVKVLRRLAKVPIQIEPDPQRLRPFDAPKLIAENSRIRALGWQPQFSLQESLESSLQYWRSL